MRDTLFFFLHIGFFSGTVVSSAGCTEASGQMEDEKLCVNCTTISAMSRGDLFISSSSHF